MIASSHVRPRSQGAIEVEFLERQDETISVWRVTWSDPLGSGKARFVVLTRADLDPEKARSNAIEAAQRMAKAFAETEFSDFEMS